MVRMRSAVRIRPAAPHKPCNHNGYRVLVLSADTEKMRFDYYLTTGTHHSAKKRSAQVHCVFSFLLFLRVKDVFQRRRCAAVSLPQGVGVDVQGGRCLSMAQAIGHCARILMAFRDQQRGGRMPLRYNYDKPEKPRISRVFGYLARFFILFQTEKSSREVVIS